EAARDGQPTGNPLVLKARLGLTLFQAMVLSAGGVEFRGQLFRLSDTKGLLEGLTGKLARRADKTRGLKTRFAGRCNEDLDGLIQAAPRLTWMVSLIEPSLCDCSLQV